MERPAPRSAADFEADLDRQRDLRDGHTWLKSAIAYCRWRAGQDLRPWRDKNERALRSDYQGAVRVLMTCLHVPARPTKPQLVLPAINAEPGYTPDELELMKKPVKWLVDELMKADPRLTMPRALLRLKRGKLAKMLLRAWVENPPAEAERLRA